ncbi:thioredoxin domain-containing protein [Cellulomonas sp. DKR-3]|uniref:Thioredoxin domain-containing protein n=1 Tax=Cellulomonas fulva TaxID=2835530 RepID=A0ABS5TYU1_9CELL|nr:DsbA family protein [Cellulomonas fulva]MBT0994281.1 thioredoxin domain-containing protein [Cellulomonas fulva]
MHQDPLAALAADPSTPPGQLARIATERPDLRVRIAEHPAAYPQLLDWLAGQGDADVAAAVARRRAAAASTAPPASSPASPSVTPSWQPQPLVPQPRTAHPGVPEPAPTALAPASVGTGSVETGPVETASVEVASIQTPWVATDEPAPPARRRRGLLIGIAAGVVVLLGVGAYVTWATVFSKLGGAPTAEAAVTQLLEGATSGDGIAVYGVLPPFEVDAFRDAAAPLSQVTQDAERVDVAALLDEVEIDLAGLDLTVVDVDEGLARVELTGGTLTVDADAEALYDALVDAYSGTLGDEVAQELETSRDEAVDALADGLPWSVTAADLVFPTPAGEQKPFLMAVEEDGRWFVSPLMTIGEYVTVLQGGTRGSMPSDEGERYPTADEAGAAFLGALPSATTGDLSDLAAVLSPAERRFVEVYVQAWVDDANDGDLAGSALTIDGALEATDLGGGRARLSPHELAVTVDGETVTFDGVCATAEGETRCLDESAGARELGLDQVGLVAVEDDGGWRVSMIATLADAFGTVGENVVRLQEEGKLEDPEWLTENFGDLAPGMGLGGTGLGGTGLGGMGLGGTGLDGLGLDDGALGEDGTDWTGEGWTDEDWTDEGSGDVTAGPAPATGTATGGIPVSDEGVGVAGDGDTVVAVYVDLMCPFCAQMHAAQGADLVELARQDGVTVEYHPIAFLDSLSQGTAYSTRAANAVAVVADRDPEHVVDFLTALLENQPTENSVGLTDVEIGELARGVGVPASVVERFTLVEGVEMGPDSEWSASMREFAPWVVAGTTSLAEQLGSVSAPRVLIDGQVWPEADTSELYLPGALANAVRGAARS